MDGEDDVTIDIGDPLERNGSVVPDPLAFSIDQWPDAARRAFEVERRHRLIAERLHIVAQRITAEENLDDALAAVLRAAESLFGAVTASILLAEHQETVPNRRFTTRHTGQPHWDDHVRVRPQGVTMRALRTGESVLIGDTRVDPYAREAVKETVGAYAAIPIRYGERITGVLFVDWDKPRGSQPTGLGLLEMLAAYGAIAIEHARLRTRDKALRLETEAARDRLQEFLGMVAHDLRGPIGVVATSIELLRESRHRTRADVEQHILPATENAVRRMRRLVDDLLGAARIGSGRFHVRPFPMDLIDIARRIVEQQQTPSGLHRLVLEAPERLEGDWDPERISQLLTNLIANGIKYSPEGGEIRTVISPGTDEIVIKVTDHGVGFDPAQSSLLFQPFVRLSHEPDTDGLGLGLYIAKAIVEAHGGRIWVESQVESGSTFFVALPRVVGGATPTDLD
ncbi:MAG: ATP-binding protein [Chloroflexota bacterium]